MMSHELQGFQFRTFGVTSSGDGGYPKQAVTDLLPCSFYTYEISTSDQSFLFYNGSFQTTFSMEDFDLNLHDSFCLIWLELDRIWLGLT